MRNNYVTAQGQEAYSRLVNVAMPAGRTGKPAAEHYGYVLAVTGSSKQAAAAWKFVRWLTLERQAEGTTRMGNVMAALGSIPVTHDDLRSQPIRHESYMMGYAEILNRGYTCNLNEAPPFDIRNTLAKAVLPAPQGTVGAQAALLEAQRVLQVSLDEYLATQRK